jgi:hypothetical protein
MGKIDKLKELENAVRKEKVRLADEMMLAVETQQFDASDMDALVVAIDVVNERIDYLEDCKENSCMWDGLWGSQSEAELNRLHAFITTATEMYNKAFKAWQDSIAF